MYISLSNSQQWSSLKPLSAATFNNAAQMEGQANQDQFRGQLLDRFSVSSMIQKIHDELDKELQVLVCVLEIGKISKLSRLIQSWGKLPSTTLMVPGRVSGLWQPCASDRLSTVTQVERLEGQKRRLSGRSPSSQRWSTFCPWSMTTCLTRKRYDEERSHFKTYHKYRILQWITLPRIFFIHFTWEELN